MASTLPHILLVLGVIVLLASLDDLLVDLLAYRRLKGSRVPSLPQGRAPTDARNPKIAIFVANWQEANVLGPMVERNLSNFTYKNVKFVLGVYPNDTETLAVAMRLADQYGETVQVVVNRRAGPTSKGQMLNEMFAQLYVKPATAPDLVVLHDSEDVIAPQSFEVYALESARHAMIQIPIFSIDSRHRSVVGATYMEEFAERHTREMLLREKLGAFVPSAGVGTCLRKDLIVYFLNSRGHVLQPGSVTEDYILGAEAHQAGYSTKFAAYRDGDDAGAPLIATREYFPKEFWASVRQRTRWTYGIGFEGAKRLGWFGSAANRFFLYRDRKGAIANFLPLLSLGLLLLCLLVRPDFTEFGPFERLALYVVLGFNSISILNRIYWKVTALREVYGRLDLLGVAQRWPVALTINAFAAARAWRSFVVESGLASRPIAWAKTTHELPADFAMAGGQLALAGSGARATGYASRAARFHTYRRRGAGAVAFACFAFLIAGGLRLHDLVIAPVTGTNVAAGFSAEIDQEERRVVESEFKRLAAGLAATSLATASRKERQILTSAIAPSAQELAALIEATDITDAREDSEVVDTVETSAKAIEPYLRINVAALAENSLRSTADAERVIAASAEPMPALDAHEFVVLKDVGGPGGASDVDESDIADGSIENIDTLIAERAAIASLVAALLQRFDQGDQAIRHSVAAATQRGDAATVTVLDEISTEAADGTEQVPLPSESASEVKSLAASALIAAKNQQASIQAAVEQASVSTLENPSVSLERRQPETSLEPQDEVEVVPGREKPTVKTTRPTSSVRKSRSWSRRGAVASRPKPPAEALPRVKSKITAKKKSSRVADTAPEKARKAAGEKRRATTFLRRGHKNSMPIFSSASSGAAANEM